MNISYSPQLKSYVKKDDYCHYRINTLGEESRLKRNSILECKSSMLSQKSISLPKINQKETKKIKNNNFYISKKKKSVFALAKTTLQDNPQALLLEKQKIEKNIALRQKMQELRNMRLLDGLNLKNVKYQGHIRPQKVYNDYHSSKTNGGYSRSKTGGIYLK